MAATRPVRRINSMTRTSSRQAGLTLVELAIALGLSAAVALSAWQLMSTALQLASRGAGQAAAQQAVRVALDRMSDQVRQAAAVADIRPDRLSLAIQAEGDADQQRVTFAVRSDGALVERFEGSTRVKLLIDGKDAHVRTLALAYYDAQGLPASTADEIRLVRVALTAQSVRGQAARSQQTFTVTTMVRLRREP